jgi:hypothetical protein
MSLMRLPATGSSLAVIALLVPLLASSPAAAQDAALPPWLDVVIVRARLGHQLDFEDRLVEYMKARRTAGMPQGNVFQVTRGYANEYHIVTPIESLAGNETGPTPMPAEDMTRWEMRITQSTDSARFFYARTYPQHNIAAPDGAAPPQLLLLQTVYVVPGRGSDYESWVAEQLMPAMREAGVQGHTMSRGSFGDDIHTYYHATPIADWAELDKGDRVRLALGERRYQQVIAGLTGIVESQELLIARVRTDLMAQE